eukprot:UN08432
MHHAHVTGHSLMVTSILWQMGWALDCCINTWCIFCSFDFALYFYFCCCASCHKCCTKCCTARSRVHDDAFDYHKSQSAAVNYNLRDGLIA